MRFTAKIGLSLYMGLVLISLTTFDVISISQTLQAASVKKISNKHVRHYAHIKHLPSKVHVAALKLPSPLTRLGAVQPITPATRIKHSWHYATVLATAYLIQNVQDDPAGRCPVYNNLTASGTHVRRGVVAVDTGVFPFGTHFQIPGYGTGRARDTGGFINGRHIDLAMTSCKEAHKWGAKHVLVAYETPHNN